MKKGIWIFFATTLTAWKAACMYKGQDSMWEVWGIFLAKLETREEIMNIAPDLSPLDAI